MREERSSRRSGPSDRPREGGVVTWRAPRSDTAGQPAASLSARAFHRCSRGQGVLEFALVVPMALLLFVGILEMSHYYYTRLTLRHSVLEATRFAVTGSRVIDERSGDTLSRVESIYWTLRNASPTVPVDLQSLVLDPADGGGPGDVVRISATYQYDFSLPLIRRYFDSGLQFTVNAAMKNEPFFN